MQTPSFEMPTEIRAFAEKSVDQARTAVGTAIGSVQKAAEQMQTSGKTVEATMQAALAKGFENAHTNVNAVFDFAQKLVQTRDPREAFELQGAFLRDQMAALQAQARDFGALAKNAAR